MKLSEALEAGKTQYPEQPALEMIFGATFGRLPKDDLELNLQLHKTYPHLTDEVPRMRLYAKINQLERDTSISNVLFFLRQNGY